MLRLGSVLLLTLFLLTGLACEADPNAIESEGDYSPDSLYARIGDGRVLRSLVDYYFDLALHDSVLDLTRHNTPHAWEPNPGNIAQLKDGYFAYLSSATGGPANYTGPAISTVHQHLSITPQQFARSLELFQAAMDRAGIAPKEQEELMIILRHEKPAVLGSNDIPTTQPARPPRTRP